MKRQDKHINKFLYDRLPAPEIPADDAWAGISGMLEAVEGPEENDRNKVSMVWRSIKKFKGLLIGVSLVITSAVVALIILNAETKNHKSTTNQYIIPKKTTSTQVNTAQKTTILHSATDNSSVTTTPAGNNSLKNPSVSEPASATIADKSERSHSNGENRHSESPTANSRRTHTGVTQARAPRTPGTRNSANQNRRGTTLRPVTRLNNTISSAKLFSTHEVVRETVLPFGSEKNNTTQAQISLTSLKPLTGHFESMNNDLGNLVKKPDPANARQPSVKTPNTFWQNIHFGPEWSINRSFVSTDYLFTRADSLKHPARLAIPGLFVSKNWDRHIVTFIFNPLHSYFGDKERVAQRIDTVRVTDSIFHRIEHNTNFIKAFGINFSLQYQYQAASFLSLVGGLSYARYSAALLRKETEYSTGTIVDESHLTVKDGETLKSYIRPQQWNIRAGILLHSPRILNNRLQVGWTTIIPVSSLSLNGLKTVKSPNVQVSLRFLVK